MAVVILPDVTIMAESHKLKEVFLPAVLIGEVMNVISLGAAYLATAVITVADLGADGFPVGGIQILGIFGLALCVPFGAFVCPLRLFLFVSLLAQLLA